MIFTELFAKSLYRSSAGDHFYGTEYYEQLLRAVFSCFQGQK